MSASHTQPQISTRYQLLLAGLVIDGLAIDLHGTDGEVCAVSLAGSRVDLEAVVFHAVYDKAQAQLDKLAPQMLRQSRDEARAERHQWHLEAA